MKFGSWNEIDDGTISWNKVIDLGVAIMKLFYRREWLRRLLDAYLRHF